MFRNKTTPTMQSTNEIQLFPALASSSVSWCKTVSRLVKTLGTSAHLLAFWPCCRHYKWALTNSLSFTHIKLLEMTRKPKASMGHMQRNSRGRLDYQNRQLWMILTTSTNPYSLASWLVLKILPVLFSLLASAARCAMASPGNSTDSPSLGEAKNVWQ